MFFKSLVSVTCVAILAAVGFYFWQDHQNQLDDQQKVKALELAVQYEQQRSWCLKTLAYYTSNQRTKTGDNALRDVERCMKDGYLSTDDIASK